MRGNSVVTATSKNSSMQNNKKYANVLKNTLKERKINLLKREKKIFTLGCSRGVGVCCAFYCTLKE